MERIEKTVFLSYRRTNFPWALAIFQDLTQHGYDVFFDYLGIASGDFESVILGNITARAHSLVLLTPSALERCNDPADWLRREIETALANQRNPVPLMLEGFDFGTPKIASQLTGNLAALKHYNGLSIPPEYFREAMERLRNKYLNVPLNAVLHPAFLSAQRAATEQKAAAAAAPAVQFQFYSCFISYSAKDQAFAERLHDDLQNKGVRCWFAPNNIQPGKKIHDQIDEAIRIYDRLLLIISEASMNSEWVKTEITKARQKELDRRQRVFFPISLVPFETVRDWETFDADSGKDLARDIRKYFIPDFSDWKNHDSYQHAFEQLLKDIKTEERSQTADVTGTREMIEIAKQSAHAAEAAMHVNRLYLLVTGVNRSAGKQVIDFRQSIPPLDALKNFRRYSLSK